MNDKESRDAAIAKKTALGELVISLDRPVHTDLVVGFDAAWDEHAAGQWVAITDADSLPKESGEYIWQRKTVNSYGHLFISDDIDVDEIDEQWWLREYVAWRKVEPYAPTDATQTARDGSAETRDSPK